MDNHINLVKLCVGVETVDDLEQWQIQRRAQHPDELPRHVTRMWPRREKELLNGGSLYWVFKGVILARQRVLRLDEHRGNDGIGRCAIVFDPELVRTEAVQRRPFQGWRYLQPADAPADLATAREMDDALPTDLAMALAEIGVR